MFPICPFVHFCPIPSGSSSKEGKMSAPSTERCFISNPQTALRLSLPWESLVHRSTHHSCQRQHAPTRHNHTYRRHYISQNYIHHSHQHTVSHSNHPSSNALACIAGSTYSEATQFGTLRTPPSTHTHIHTLYNHMDAQTRPCCEISLPDCLPPCVYTALPFPGSTDPLL